MLSNLLNFSFPSEIIENEVSFDSNSITFNYPCSSLNDCHPFTVTFQKGTYKIECYGAGYSPNDITSSYSYGAYTKGVIKFIKTETLYFYLGASLGKYNAVMPEAFISNGREPCGSTDIRINDGDYYSFDSLKSRIMVAASGGGSDSYYGEYGHAGTLKGFRGLANVSRGSIDFPDRIDDPMIAPGGTQTEGGQCDEHFTDCYSGQFGLSNHNPESTNAGG